MSPRPLVIAIDGPAASGKGTLARRLAAHLGLCHLDTGLLYRGVAEAMLSRGLDLTDAEAAARTAAALDLVGLDPARLRGERAGEGASVVSAHAGVRAELLSTQRRFAANPAGAVLDGRDIGTVVCPDAGVKLFVTAAPEERALRRVRELQAAGTPTSFETVLSDIRERDHRDETRRVAPLRPAADAHILDTTLLGAEDAFLQALKLVERITQVRPRVRVIT